MLYSRRHVLRAGAAAVAVAGLGARERANAQTGTVETARVVTGFAAGGTADILSRRVASKLSPGYAAAALVDNRAGAGGQLAISYVKSQPADGATILQTPNSMLTIFPHIYAKLPYDPVADLTPVSLGATFDFAFAVGPAVPASVRTVPDFLAWSKANPGGANFGSPGAGSTPHFIGTLLGLAGGADLRHVVYRGSQPAILDMMAGNLSAVCGPLGEFTQQLAGGKARLLAVSGARRSRFAPEVPTLVEQGYKDMAITQWYAFFLPPRAAPEVVARLHGALASALASKEIVDGLNLVGLEAASSSPAELADLLKKDSAMWAPIVKKIGFRADA